MLCAISGEFPKEAVVSKSTGLIYERRLIEKSINDYQKCPVTGISISHDDLVEIKNTAKASQTKSVNISGTIDNLQTNFDDLLLETLTLRQELDVTRKELAHALYQHDAACRVIARLIKERDEARNALQHFTANGFTHTQAKHNNNDEENHHMDVSEKEAVPEKESESGISDTLLSELNSVNRQLTTARKQRKISEGLVSKDKMATTTEIRKLSSANQQSYSVVDIGKLHENGRGVAAVATEAGFVHFLDVRNSAEVFESVHAHESKVNALQFLPGSSKKFVTGGCDRAVKLWSLDRDNNFVNTFNYSKHDGEVVALTIHPTSKYVVSASSQGSWRFLDLVAGVNCKTVKCNDVSLSTCKLHVDGLVLGTGSTAGEFTIWDLREQKQVSTLKDHTKAITCIDFSENGYFCVTGSKDGLVKVWDLRKLSCVKSLDNGFESVSSARFDFSGVYIGAVGASKANGKGRASVTVVKEYTNPFVSDVDTVLNSIAWGDDAEYFLAAASDATVRVFEQRAV